MKSNSSPFSLILGVLALAALVVFTGEDLERFFTDVQREREHPSLANAARTVGAFARLVKDGIGWSEV
ncbi:hypothetical protein [Sulfobacillus thermosulfidooxidans]|uniref:hypothetical protein n=1 Tax=Sulfobacillus thermosulfidooxidans TaxID=28034 RepID=UPI0006B4B029|nr:hypothetical protein [Sulfobacillus thermosulfidooxidans]